MEIAKLSEIYKTPLALGLSSTKLFKKSKAGVDKSVDSVTKKKITKKVKKKN